MAHLVFIPSPGAGHLLPFVELAKLLIDRGPHLSVSILIMTRPGESLATSLEPQDRITYVHLSHDGFVPDTTKPPWMAFPDFINYHKPQITGFLAESTRSESTRLAGVVVDMFCMTLADNTDVPRYIFFTPGAGFLCLAFHALGQDLTQFKDSDAELAIPGFVNSVPAKVLPTGLTGGDWSKMFLSWVATFKDTKGILVNTFFELQSHAIRHLLEDDTIPPIYPVGPLLTLKDPSGENHSIISWLDRQPPSSVVFICFGTTGCFNADQVMEIALALENSGTRFLWSLRRPLLKEELGLTGYYKDVAEGLPKGFLERTGEIGKVIGWAPQAAVLSHPSVGGFISHCGWNSTLESLWYGVPVATWPLYADQQCNAFELVKELGVAVDLKLDYKKDFGAEANCLVKAEEIEKAIKQLMEVSNSPDSQIKQKVMDMSKKSRMAVAKGGSSYSYLDRFIEGVFHDLDSKK